MRNLIMAGLMATSLLPAAAQAQYGGWGSDRGVARELHRDRDEYRDYRGGDRDGGWHARRGYDEPRRHVDNWQRYGHSRSYGDLRWVRRGYDALLVDTRTGYVVRVIRNRYW